MGDAWVLALHVFSPSHCKIRAPVFMLHGLGGNRLHFDLSQRYSLVRAATRRGFAAYVLELRGAGLSRVGKTPERACAWGFADYLEHDLPAAWRTLRAHCGLEYAFAVGHSLGGMLLLAAITGGLATGLRALVTIGTPLLQQLPLGLKEQQFLDLAKRLCRGQSNRLFPMRRLLGGAGRVFLPFVTGFSDGIALNPSNMDTLVTQRFVREGIDDVSYRLIGELSDTIRYPAFRGPYEYEHHLGRVSIPVLALSGSLDRIAPPISVAALTDRLRAPDVRLRELGIRNGDRTDYGHADLLVGRHAPEDVYPQILDFFEEYI